MFDFLQTHLLAPTNHFEALSTSTGPHRAPDPGKLFRIPSALDLSKVLAQPYKVLQQQQEITFFVKIDWNTRIHTRDRQLINPPMNKNIDHLNWQN